MHRAPSLREVERRADSNVVILPTAPRRMVKQNYSRVAWTERKKLKDESPFIASYRDPQLREALKRASVMRDVQQTPELAVLLLMLDTVPREQRQAMIEKIAMRAVVNPMFRQAVEIIRSTMLTFGEEWDMLRALDMLAKGDAA